MLTCATHRKGHINAPAKRGPRAPSLQSGTMSKPHGKYITKTSMHTMQKQKILILKFEHTFESSDCINAAMKLWRCTATTFLTTLNFQCNWRSLYEPAILESIKMAASESIRATPSLTHYFVTTRPGPTPQPKFDKRHHKTKRRRKHVVHNKHTFANHRIPRYFLPRSGAITTNQPPSHRTNRTPPRSLCTQLIDP
jgi:hypothetical protein